MAANNPIPFQKNESIDQQADSSAGEGSPNRPELEESLQQQYNTSHTGQSVLSFIVNLLVSVKYPDLQVRTLNQRRHSPYPHHFHV